MTNSRPIATPLLLDEFGEGDGEGDGKGEGDNDGDSEGDGGEDGGETNKGMRVMTATFNPILQ
jgi:hypothetical protein